MSKKKETNARPLNKFMKFDLDFKTYHSFTDDLGGNILGL